MGEDFKGSLFVSETERFKSQDFKKNSELTYNECQEFSL